jgi:predicted DNA-binding protein with PD1-like motif
MRARQFGQEHVLVLEPGERALETITNYLKQHRIGAGRFSAIGGFRHTELKYYNATSKQYESREVNKQVEVDSLIGNVALVDGAPYIHAHVNVSDQDYRVYSGHLGEGIVGPTLEVFLTQITGPLVREKNEQSGLEELHPEPGIQIL